MKLFLLNLLLALLWAAINGDFAGETLVAGFVLGYLVLLAARPALGPSKYYTGLWRVIGFALFYVWELILSSLRVAYDVLTPTFHMNPGILAMPLDAKSDAEITTVANLISLTPGTLSLDLSPDRKMLYIHAMYVDDDDPNALRQSLKDEMESRVLGLVRGAEPLVEKTAATA